MNTVATDTGVDAAPDDELVGAWMSLARANARVLSGIEAALKAAGLPRLEWYDALWEIEKAAPDGIRPVDLQPRLLLPQYGLSRLIDRLVRQGLVERRPVPGDRRGQVLALTPPGLAMRARMWPVYDEELRRALGSLTPEAARRLARALDGLGAG